MTPSRNQAITQSQEIARARELIANIEVICRLSNDTNHLVSFTTNDKLIACTYQLMEVAREARRLASSHEIDQIDELCMLFEE